MCFFKSRIRNDSRIPEGSRRDRDYDALIIEYYIILEMFAIILRI